MRVFSLSGLPERKTEERLDCHAEHEELRLAPPKDLEKWVQRSANRKRRVLWTDERGLASVEYVILLVAVTLGAALLVAAMGPQVIRSFEWQVAVLGLPIP